MNICRKYLHYFLLPLYLACGIAQAEDIDIFAGTKDVDVGLPNVIFVLDNTSNWSRQSQQWPGGLVQGQSEVRAIKLALQAQLGELNVGIVEYVTGGSSADTDAGYVRFDLQPYNATSQPAFEAVLDKIFSDINAPEEKRSSSNPYGDLPWDFYNYLSGINHSNSGTGTPANLADPAGYTTQWSVFQSPLVSQEALCGDTYMIFIGNNVNGNIAGDDITNTNALKAAYTAAGKTAPDALYGDAGSPLPIPEFVVTETQGPPILVPEEVVPPTTVTAATLGSSAACYRSNKLGDCATDERNGGLCNGLPASLCQCTTPTTGTTGCGNNQAHYTVKRLAGTIPGYTIPAHTIPGEIITEITASGQYDDDGGHDYNFDDWAKFLKNVGVPVSIPVVNEEGETETVSERVNVTTYVIDVFNRQSNPDLSGVWFGAANAGGGRYFQAKSEEQIIAAIQATLGDILAVSSSFSAVTMPLSTNNSARFANEIYVGMFRPAPGKEPRWYGNLKLFELASFNGEIEIADRNRRRAINPLTGFARDCAETWWTYDSDTYWENLGVNPSMESACQEALDAGKEWSDLPDGPFVEKGGVAQVTRLDPSSLGRTLYTVQSGALDEIDDGNEAAIANAIDPTDGAEVLEYVQGIRAGVGEVMPDPNISLRSTIHGGVVHSRPIAVRYDDGSIIVYYGADDGVFRAVDAAFGQEVWGFIAPEHFSKLARLYENTPLIDYEGASQDPSLDYAPKDYFFDGSTGSLITYAAPDDPDSQALGELESAYIYPIMRRGGRMVYAFDVTDPDAPELMWRQGCPNLDNDTGCTTGFTDMGQTWSMPIGIKVAGYPDANSDPEPLVIFGGGFDSCLDADQAAYPAACSSAKGKGVYLLDAVDGDLVKTFATDAPVVGDVAPVDLNADGLTDFVYLADMAGNIYRISNADLVQDLTGLVDVPDGAVVAIDDPDDWVIEKIAATSVNTQRFMNSVTAGIFQGTIFVTVGSGDRERPLEANYPYAADVQNYFYVLADSPYRDYTEELEAEGGPEPYTRRVVDLTGPDMYQVGTAFPVDKPNITLYEGYYWPLADRGEQVSSPSAIGGGKVLFSTFQPGGVSVGICEEPLGIGQAYTLDLFNPVAPEVDTCAGGGYCLPDTIFPVEGVFEGCEDGEECDNPCPEDDPDCLACPDDQPNCRPAPPPCEGPDCNQFGCIRGGFDFCDLDPNPDPTRSRTFFTEDIDRD